MHIRKLKLPTQGHIGRCCRQWFRLLAETGTLKYLQFYNLTCNDCGGRDTPNCLNATSCALPVSNCTCPAAVQAAADNTTTNNTDGASVCNYGNFT